MSQSHANNMIQIEQLDAATFKVMVNNKTPTSHMVTVKPEYAQRLTQGKISVEVLLKRSFEFLLAREPNTSILRSFELSVIARYFPEYEQVMLEMQE